MVSTIRLYIKNFNDASLLSKCLAVYGACIPLDFIQVASGISVVKLVSIFVIFAALLKIGSFRLDTTKVGALFYLFALLNVVDAGIAVHSNAFSSFITIVLNMLLCLIMLGFEFTDSEKNLIAKSLVISGWLALILLLVSSNSINSSGRLSAVVAGSQQDPNYYCGYFLFAVGFHAMRYFSNLKLLDMCALFLFFVGICFTGSRGGLFAFFSICGIAIVVSLLSLRIAIKSLVSAVLFFGLAIFLIPAAMRLLPNVVSERFSIEYIINHGMSGRSEIWSQLIQGFMDSGPLNMIFGSGISATQTMNTYGDVSHNLWLELLVNSGIAGVVLFSLMLAYAAWQCVFTRQYQVLCALIGLGALCLSISGITLKCLWMCVGLSFLSHAYEPRVATLRWTEISGRKAMEGKQINDRHAR